MNTTLEYVAKKFNIPDARLNDRQKYMPIEIPGMSRDTLANLFSELQFKTGAEIGVESGLYSLELCKRIPDLHLFSIDPWKAYYGYRDHVNQAKLDGFYETTKQRLAPYNSTLIKKYSMDALKDFADRSLDFVYIDGNHTLLHVVSDIVGWTKKIKFGGILAGHDFVWHKAPTEIHVIPAVLAYTTAYEIRPWFVCGTKEDTKKDGARSYFWIVQPLRGRKNAYDQG